MIDERRRISVDRFTCFGPDKLEIKIGEKDRIVLTKEEAEQLASLLVRMCK